MVDMILRSNITYLYISILSGFKIFVYQSLFQALSSFRFCKSVITICSMLRLFLPEFLKMEFITKIYGNKNNMGCDCKISLQYIIAFKMSTLIIEWLLHYPWRVDFYCHFWQITYTKIVNDPWKLISFPGDLNGNKKR